MNFRYISAWSIRNPIIPIVFFIGLTLAGLVSFSRMDVNSSPDIDFAAQRRPSTCSADRDELRSREVEAAVPGQRGHEIQCRARVQQTTSPSVGTFRQRSTSQNSVAGFLRLPDCFSAGVTKQYRRGPVATSRSMPMTYREQSHWFIRRRHLAPAASIPEAASPRGASTRDPLCSTRQDAGARRYRYAIISLRGQHRHRRRAAESPARASRCACSAIPHRARWRTPPQPRRRADVRPIRSRKSYDGFPSNLDFQDQRPSVAPSARTSHGRVRGHRLRRARGADRIMKTNPATSPTSNERPTYQGPVRDLDRIDGRGRSWPHRGFFSCATAGDFIAALASRSRYPDLCSWTSLLHT